MQEPAPAEPALTQRWAFVCEASSCRYDGSMLTREALAQCVGAQPPGATAVSVVRTGCLGLCGAGPVVVTYPEGEVHLHVEPGDAAELAESLAGRGGAGRRRVRAPQWYRDHITSRLGYLIDVLRRRTAGTGA